MHNLVGIQNTADEFTTLQAQHKTMEHQKNYSRMNWSVHNPNTTKAKKSPKVTYNR